MNRYVWIEYKVQVNEGFIDIGFAILIYIQWISKG